MAIREQDVGPAAERRTQVEIRRGVHAKGLVEVFEAPRATQASDLLNYQPEQQARRRCISDPRQSLPGELVVAPQGQVGVR